MASSDKPGKTAKKTAQTAAGKGRQTGRATEGTAKASEAGGPSRTASASTTGPARELKAPVTNFSLPGGVGSKAAGASEGDSGGKGAAKRELKAPVTDLKNPRKGETPATSTASSVPPTGTTSAGAKSESATGAKPAAQSARATDPTKSEPAHSSGDSGASATTTGGATAAPAHPAPRRSAGSVFLLLLGGVIAAAIGFGAAFYAMGGLGNRDDGFRSETSAALQDQSEEIAALRDQLSGAAQSGDVQALSGRLDELEAASGVPEEVTQRLDSLEGRIDEIAARLDELEKRPVSEGVSEEAIAAYERELQRLQDSVAQQRQEVESMAANAAEMEQNAQETARQTMARSAATRILTSLQAGDGFASALADLEETGTEVPELLRQVADEGVATRAALTERFPDASRRALAAARDAAPQEGDMGSRVGNFLRDQLGARSVAPREGDDPDAILSRAEAAVKANRLGDALAEIETLPDVAQAEMKDWVADATARRDALQAAEQLAQDLNQ